MPLAAILVPKGANSIRYAPPWEGLEWDSERWGLTLWHTCQKGWLSLVYATVFGDTTWASLISFLGLMHVELKPMGRTYCFIGKIGLFAAIVYVHPKRH